MTTQFYGWLMMLPFLLLIVGVLGYCFYMMYKFNGLKYVLWQIAFMVGIVAIQVLFMNGLKLALK